MLSKRYLVLLLLAMNVLVSVLTGCASIDEAINGPRTPTATPEPFAFFTGQQVIDALRAAGLSVENPEEQALTIGRDAPLTYNHRSIFEISRIAPDGGQILVFDDPAGLQAWQDYIARLSQDSSTRRDVVYTYVHRNILLQLNANLLPDEATRYRRALEAMG